MRLLFPAISILLAGRVFAADLSVSDYGSIQEALDSNPGRMVHVPAGNHVIDQKIQIRGERSGLFGPGRIIQQNADQPILEIVGASGAEVRDVTLTRPEGKMETSSEAIFAIQCRDLVIENVRVIDNRSPAPAISMGESQGCRISHCLVRNYMRVWIDDRTQGDAWGYAFHCTDGTGIWVNWTAPGGECLRLPFTFYSDFWRLRNAHLHGDYYFRDQPHIQNNTPFLGIFEVALHHWPDVPNLKAIVRSMNRARIPRSWLCYYGLPLLTHGVDRP